jgi:hypothetical protein
LAGHGGAGHKVDEWRDKFVKLDWPALGRIWDRHAVSEIVSHLRVEHVKVEQR